MVCRPAAANQFSPSSVPHCLRSRVFAPAPGSISQPGLAPAPGSATGKTPAWK